MLHRKIISCLLAALMALTCVSGVAFANSGEYTVDESTFAVKVAQGLGAIDEYDADKKVTVGDFKKAIDKLLKNEGLAALYFKSSKADTQEIRCIDAAAVMCDILGYGVFYGSKGYGETKTAQMMLIATKYGLLSGVSERNNETLTMKSLVNMLYNVLNAKTLSTSYSNGGEYHASLTDKKYIEDVMNMEFINGVVQSTRFSSITREKGTGDNSIIINGVSYKCNIDEFENYIGMEIRALASYNRDEKEILALFDNGKAISIDADDLAFSEITKRNITYYNDRNKSINVSISATADVLYNFSLLRDWTAEDLKVRQGKLVCIDNNGDGAYDVIKIEEYKSMQILSASVEAKQISDPNGNAVSMAKLIEDDYPIYEKGARITPNNIPVGSVATYFTDKSGEIVRIYITTEVAAGTVKSFKKNKNKVLLDEHEYSYTDELKVEIEQVATGTVITAVLNHYGELAEFEKTKDSFLYGYLTSFATEKNFTNPKVKIFTQDNEFKVYNTESKIDINGTRMKSADAFEYNLNSGLWDEAGKINQIVKYKVNSANCITALRTATSYDVGQPERLLKQKDGVYTYYSDPKTICADTRLNISTKVFLIPTDLGEKTKFKYGTYSILGNDTDYTCQVYDIDEDRYADVVVARIDPWGKKSVDDIGGNVYMVDETGTYLNDRGEEAPVITAHKLGAAEPTTEEIKFNRNDISAAIGSVAITSGTLRQGDIIMVSSDETHSQEMANFKLWYRPGETKPYESVKQYWYSAATIDTFISDGNCYAAGKVIKIVKNGVIINNKPEDTEDYEKWNRIITLKSNTPVYILDKNKGKITQGSIADLMPGDKIFSLLSRSLPKEMVIYRNF